MTGEAGNRKPKGGKKKAKPKAKARKDPVKKKGKADTSMPPRRPRA